MLRQEHGNLLKPDTVWVAQLACFGVSPFPRRDSTSPARSSEILKHECIRPRKSGRRNTAAVSRRARSEKKYVDATCVWTVVGEFADCVRYLKSCDAMRPDETQKWGHSHRLVERSCGSYGVMQVLA